MHDLYQKVFVTGGGLAGLGAPVFDATGTAIGLAGWNAPAVYLLNQPGDDVDAVVMGTVRSFLPTATFDFGLADPPTPDRPVVDGNSGLGQLDGLSDDEAAYLGLTGTPAVRVGDLFDGSAGPAGVRPGDVIVSVDGHRLQTGDAPADVPDFLKLYFLRLPPGTRVTLGIVRGRPGQRASRVDVPVVLGRCSPEPYQARRTWYDHLGFGVRELTAVDRYAQHLPPTDAGGVVVTVLKPNEAAQTAGLQPSDLLVQFNGRPTPGLDAFGAAAAAVRPHDAVVLVVKRQRREQTIRIDPPQ